jgi:kumamolisin
VFGLDNRPQARPFFRCAAAPSAPPGPSFSPVTVARMHNFPAAVGATGQCIALLEFGGGGYHRTDVRNWFASLGPGHPEPSLVDVGGDYASNSPGSDSDQELLLDIDMAGAAAPGARIAVYFAPCTEQGRVDAISTAIHDAKNDPSVQHDVPRCGAGRRDRPGRLRRTGSDAGVGDHRAHVQYPAADPFVTSCGGTTLLLPGGENFREELWRTGATGSGGGISVNFPVPPGRVRSPFRAVSTTVDPAGGSRTSPGTLTPI